MELVTKETILNGLVDRMERVYDTNFHLDDGRWSNDVLSLLKAENPLTEKRAIEIIGNKSWTRNTCDECSKDVYAAVKLGQDDESDVKVCFSCLERAVKVAKSVFRPKNL